MSYYRIDRFKITHFHKRCENNIEEKSILTSKFIHSEGLHTCRGENSRSEVNTDSWTEYSSLAALNSQDIFSFVELKGAAISLN